MGIRGKQIITSDIHNAMLDDSRNGMTDGDLSKKYDICRNTIHTWRIRNKLPCNYEKGKIDKDELHYLYYNGLTDSEIAEICGYKLTTVSNWRTGLRYPPNSIFRNIDKEAKIIEMYFDKKIPIADIAGYFNVKIVVIRETIKRLLNYENK